MFLLIGRFIEVFMRQNTGDAVGALASLRPVEAQLVEGAGSSEKTITRINVEMIEFGDLILVVNGASPPCDGIVLDGHSKFDESSLSSTGESKPVSKAPGDTVFSGTINNAGPVTIRATGVSGKSMLDSIIQVIRDGQARRAPVERIADTITGYFVPLIVLVAIITWITWLALGECGVLPPDYRNPEVGGWLFWSLQFAIATFVVACPCGLGLAAPTALFVGGGLAAKNDILVKGGGEAFQEASHLDCIVFDKTGTLTEGARPRITDERLLLPSDDAVYEATLLGILKRLEEKNSHPLASAIVAMLSSRPVADVETIRIDEFPGKGLLGLFKKTMHPQVAIDALIGNEELLADHQIEIPSHVKESLDQWNGQAKSVALMASRATVEGISPQL